MPPEIGNMVPNSHKGKAIKSMNKAAMTQLLTQQFMELRQYVEKLEKSAVRQQYFLDTRRVATHIGTIKWAAKLAGKSEITIRRHIAEKKIWAFQITKFWWIPREEIKVVNNEGEHE